MSRSIRSTAAPANQKQTEFIQSILAKYGLTRWRSKLKDLILRHNPLYAAEPETLQRTDLVTNHIHQSFYYPAVTGKNNPGPASRILLITQSRSTAGLSAQSASPGQAEDLRSGLHSAAGRFDSVQVLQERVSQHRNNQHQLTTEYRIRNTALHPAEPVAAHPAGARQVQVSAPSGLSVLKPQPLGVTAERSGGDRQNRGELPTASVLPGQQDRVTGRPAHTVHHQQQLVQVMQLLRTYGVKQERETGAEAQPLWQKSGHSVRAKSLKHERETVPGSVGTAVEAQLKTPTLSFKPDNLLLPHSSVNTSLQLGLGQQLTATLEQLESRQELLSPLLSAVSTVHQRQPMKSLQLAQPQILLPLGDASGAPAAARRAASARMAAAGGRSAPRGPGPAAPVEADLIYAADRTELPSAPQRRSPGSQLLKAGPAYEPDLQPSASHSRLVLRKPEAPRAALPEPMQQQLERVLQEQAAQAPAQAFTKAVPPPAMNAAELNQLAERVYQVLEKRMAIRKDRRGLR
ncbi:hypothetical protein [Paenibacillus sp. FSL R7-0333]|uniref:hypothetical protein n=1 Tax=Paenibacillus sp. FSL R7-0333 TaxID=1926587 RepID=UPI00096FCA49|nr:hypothetical protein BK146_27035 [Paenibacillus sp. FSL R7-0333]